MLALGIGVHAQMVSVGTGNSTSSTGTNGSPIYRSSASSSYNYSQSVELLTSADLAAAGLPAGATITKIAYYKANAETLSAGRTATMKLYMKNSSSAALNGNTTFATWTTGSTNVYNNPTFGSVATDLPAAAGWVEFNLSTPFSYSGGSLETAIDWSINSGTGNPTTGGFTWQYTSATAVQSVGTSDSAPITSSLSTTYPRLYNVQITYTITPCTGTPSPGNTLSSTTPTCPGPYTTTLTAQNATAGSGVTYQWFKNGVAITGATSQSYTATVTAGDSYYVAVTCGGNTGNSTPITVTAPIANLVPPYTNTFSPFPGSCWSQASGGTAATGPASTSTYWFEDSFLNAGTTSTGAAKINLYSTNRTGWLISPTFNLTAGNYRVKFDYGVTDYDVTTPASGWGADDKVQFLMSTDGGTTWTVLQTWDSTNIPSNSTNNYVNILPASALVNNVKFAFYGTDGTTDDTSDFEFFVDNFVIDSVPTCAEPTNVVTTVVTATTANVTWQATNPVPANGYTVYYSTTNTAPTSGTVLNATNSVSSTTTSATLTGLTTDATYYVWVRSNCSTTNSSPWTGPANVLVGYCAPAPSSVDGQGITNVTFGSAPNIVNNTTVAETNNYGNYSSMIGDVTGGVATPVSITFQTGYTYDTTIWVDLNNNLVFEASEALYTGQSTSTNPTTLSASITIPAGTPNGQYRMRIGSQDDGPATPCYSGSFGSYEDYTVNVVGGLSTSEIAADTATMRIYPNPFADFVSIENVKDVKAVSIFDTAGRMVKKVSKVEERINTSELKTGMYIFSIEMKDGTVKTVKAIRK